MIIIDQNCGKKLIQLVKFIYSEKAQKFSAEISRNFVAFSEYMNFKKFNNASDSAFIVFTLW